MSEYKIITLDETNIEGEDICCAKSDKKSQTGVANKKAWLTARMSEGLKFKKFDTGAKTFIEYIPAKFAWKPIVAPGYMLINCLWVSGKFKGMGMGKALLEECEKDAAGMHGVVVVSGKKPFMTDPKFYIKHGYEVCDTAPPFFELLVKRFDDAPLPTFAESVKDSSYPDAPAGILVTYSAQCPFTSYYVPEMRDTAAELGIPFTAIELKTSEEAQNSATPFGTFAVYYDGEFLSHEIQSRGRLIKLLTKAGKIES